MWDVSATKTKLLFYELAHAANHISEIGAGAMKIIDNHSQSVIASSASAVQEAQLSQ